LRTNEHEPAFGMEFAQREGERTGGTAWRVLEAPPKDGELSYITYHAGLTHFLFAHIIAQVCERASSRHDRAGVE